jgi:c-di-GMP-binding flagellar brake protein YcgR
MHPEHGEAAMKDRRLHPRFTADILDMHGRSSYASNVRILDMSITGIALKTLSNLGVGSECILRIKGKDNTLTVKALVVWSSPGGSMTTPKGNPLPTYKIGMKFTDVSDEKMKEVADFIEKHRSEEDKKADVFALSGLRVYVRFRIEAPEQTTLISVKSHKILNISLGGMLMESSDALDIGSKLSLEITRSQNKSIKVLGRVASCMVLEKGYHVGIEFLDMADKDREMLREIICLLENMGFISISAMGGK